VVPGELVPAGGPWLGLDLAGGRLAVSAAGTTIVDIADPYAVPVTVNPFEPAPGYPVQAHADRLAGLFGAVFGLAGPAAAAVRAGLRRSYAGCGWDLVTGSAAPGAVAAPAVPRYRQFRRAVLATADELGYGPGVQADLHGFLRARLDGLWSGPAGRFLEGGHPVDAVGLLRASTLLTSSGVADEEAASFLAGVLLVRLAEQLRPGPGGPGPGGPGGTVVIAAGTGPAPVRAGPGQPGTWFGRLHADLRRGGTEVVAAGPAGPPGGVPGAPPASGGRRFPVLLGRRSAACGQHCQGRPCDGYELHAAGLLAREDRQAWLRLWVQTLVLAFLTGHPVPRVPAGLRSGWLLLSPRRRDCLLATVVDAAVTARAAALRPSYPPGRLIAVTGALAARLLAADGPPPGAAPRRAGPVWVIPPLRWLHEVERVHPLGRAGARLDDVAPPLDFGLAGLPDWPGIRVRDRLGGLWRHPLSATSERNRDQATLALLGDDGGTGLAADLATAGIGLSPSSRLRHVATTMGVAARGPQPGWLEVVLAWPEQITGLDQN
jgi:hypothetical protein